MLTRRLFYILTLLTFVLSFSACKSSKEKKATNTSQLSTIDYKTFNVPKVSITLGSKGNSMSINGSLRIRKDSAIMISIQPFLGMEVGRAFITQDSLMIIDRIHKRYFKTSFEEAGKKSDIGLNYNVFQAMFTEALFAYDNPKVKLSDFKEAKVGDLTMLQYSKSGIVQEFVVNDDYRVQQVSVMSDKTSYTLHWSYTKFNALENGFIFPHQIKFQASDGKRSKNLDIDYKKVEIDKDLTFDSSVPASYEKVSMDELMSMFQ